MNHAPEAFVLLSLPNASLTIGGATENGALSLECVKMPNPQSANSQDRDVYLVLRLNASETPIDPARVVRRTDVPGIRIYTFVGTQADPTELTLRFLVPPPDGSNAKLTEKLQTFENILEQYVVEFHRPSSIIPPVSPIHTAGLGVASGNKDLRGHLVMINEETGEVVGEVEDRFRIKEDPHMNQQGRENDLVIIEVPEESTRTQDANAFEAFASIVPPDQQNWVTKSAGVASQAISMTTNLLLTTITTASSYYISHSQPSPHHSNPGTPTGSGSRSPASGPPPLPPRALVFLTSENTRKGLSTVHAVSGEAVKISTKTVGVIDNMIRRAMGAKAKRTKYFTNDIPASGSTSSGMLSPTGPPLPPRTPSPSPSSRSGLAPPPYAVRQGKSAFSSSEKSLLPPRRSTSPIPPPLPHRSVTMPSGPEGIAPCPQPRLTTKERILISADLILSTIDDSARRVLDVGTEELGKVVGHKYGPEAAQSSLLMAGTARNVGLVYVDMRGVGRRALLRQAGATFVKARVGSNKSDVNPAQPSTSIVKS